MSRRALLLFFVTVGGQAQIAITTYRNGLYRTGDSLKETALTRANVNPDEFGKLFSLPVDGQVYAQPLYLPSLVISGRRHNVVFVATEHDSVYAFDTDSGPNENPIWRVSLTGAGETTATVSDVLNCSSISPEVGITGTPVIDPSTNTLYVVASSARDAHLIHRLHALDVTTGAERPGSPVVISASVPGSADGFFSTAQMVEFHPDFHKNRAGLLLLNGIVYTSWGSYCDSLAYHGWIIGYDSKDLRQVAAFNSSPNAYQGSFWMGGAAPAADADGNIYAISANGRFDANANGFDFGDSLLKLASPGLALLDYFTPFDQKDLDQYDIDLGSSGAVLLPDDAGSTAHRHLLVSAGKEGRIYLIDRDRMGRFHEGSDDQIVQSLTGAIGSLFGGPAYFNNTLYFAAEYDTLKAFSVSNAHIDAYPSSQSLQRYGYVGAVPAVTANGSAEGIVWAIEGGFGGTLHAYDASNLAIELYNSQMNGSRDAPGWLLPFSVPAIANGRVYVGTANALVVFGLLSQSHRPGRFGAAGTQRRTRSFAKDAANHRHPSRRDWGPASMQSRFASPVMETRSPAIGLWISTGWWWSSRLAGGVWIIHRI